MQTTAAERTEAALFANEGRHAASDAAIVAYDRRPAAESALETMLLADTGDEMEARARLIAAAPDLLAALRELAAVFAEDGPAYEALLEAEYEDAANSERHPSFKHVRDTVLAKARAAIAKAEARS